MVLLNLICEEKTIVLIWIRNQNKSHVCKISTCRKREGWSWKKSTDLLHISHILNTEQSYFQRKWGLRRNQIHEFNLPIMNSHTIANMKPRKITKSTKITYSNSQIRQKRKDWVISCFAQQTKTPTLRISLINSNDSDINNFVD